MYEQKENQNMNEEFVAIPKKWLDKLWGHSDIEMVISMLAYFAYEDKYPKEVEKMCLMWTDEDWNKAIKRLDELCSDTKESEE